jgi:O-antigen/teichoic acid export membrane protein
MGVVIRQSFKATIVSYVGACIGALLVIFIYPKSLTAEQIGLLRILAEASLFFSSFALLGTNSMAIKFFPYFKDDKNNHNGFSFIITFFPLIGFLIFLAGFFIFKSGIISLFEAKSGLFTKYIIFIIPLTFFWMYITIYETYASLLQRIVFPKLIKEILVRILTILIIGLFYFKIISLNQFVFLFVSIYGVATLLNIIYVNSIQKISYIPDFGFLKNPLRKEMLSFMLYMIIVGVGSNIAGRIDVFMLSQKVSLSGTGIFTIAFFIASFIEMPSRAIFQITTPFASEALKNNDMALVSSLYKRVSINQLVIASMVFLLIWINVDNIYSIMPNGQDYESGKYVILFIGMAKVFDAVTGLNAIILGYSKYYYYTLFFIFFLAILTVSNNLIFIPVYGIVGSAIATAISIFLYNAMVVLFVQLKLKVQPFSLNTLKALIIIGLFVLANLLTPHIINPYIDAIIRSGVFSVFFSWIVYKLEISKDINDLIKSLNTRYLGGFLPLK